MSDLYQDGHVSIDWLQVVLYCSKPEPKNKSLKKVNIAIYTYIAMYIYYKYSCITNIQYK